MCGGAGRKLLVFAHHKPVLDALQDAMKHMRVGDEGPPGQVGPPVEDTYSHHSRSLCFQPNGKLFVKRQRVLGITFADSHMQDHMFWGQGGGCILQLFIGLPSLAYSGLLHGCRHPVCSCSQEEICRHPCYTVSQLYLFFTPFMCGHHLFPPSDTRM